MPFRLRSAARDWARQVAATSCFALVFDGAENRRHWGKQSGLREAPVKGPATAPGRGLQSFSPRYRNRVCRWQWRSGCRASQQIRRAIVKFPASKMDRNNAPESPAWPPIPTVSNRVTPPLQFGCGELWRKSLALRWRALQAPFACCRTLSLLNSPAGSAGRPLRSRRGRTACRTRRRALGRRGRSGAACRRTRGARDRGPGPPRTTVVRPP